MPYTLERERNRQANVIFVAGYFFLFRPRWQNRVSFFFFENWKKIENMFKKQEEENFFRISKNFLGETNLSEISKGLFGLLRWAQIGYHVGPK